CRCSHVVLLNEGFTLVPPAATGSMEKLLVKQCRQDLMFSSIILEASEYIYTLVHNASINPRSIEPSQIHPFHQPIMVLNSVCSTPFFCNKHSPPWPNAFKYP